MFQHNKKLLKHKAEEELLTSFKGVFARRHAIMETLLGLKHRIVTDLIKMRLRHTFPKRHTEKAADPPSSTREDYDVDYK